MEAVCVLKDKSDIKKLRKLMSEIYVPTIVTVVKCNYELDDIINYLKDYNIKDKKLHTICKNQSCTQPFNNVENLKEYLITIIIEYRLFCLGSYYNLL